MYKLKGESILRLSDGAYIPLDHGNLDYQEYLLWVSTGNSPEPEFSVTEIRAQKIQTIKADAYKIITTHYPPWKQSNMLARWLELSEVIDKTPEQQAEMDTYRAVWAWVKSIRIQSDTFEQEVINTVDPSSYTYQFIE